MQNFCFPENCKIVNGLAPQIGAGAALTGAYVSLKDANRAWVVIQYTQGDAAAITWHVKKSPLVSGVGAVVTDVLMPIWSNLDVATSDLMVRRTDAVNYASGTGATNKVIVFEVQPDGLGQLAGVQYDCIAGCSTTVVAAVVNWVSILYVLENKNPSRVIQQRTAITD